MSNSNIIMGIETSAVLCSIAWWKSGNVLLEYNVEQKNRHAELLPELAERGFHYLGIDKKMIGLLAVAAGPGSFTGLRIGMAFAKGFCYALDKRLVAVSNFDLMMASADNKNGSICALIDAGRGNLYRAICKNKFDSSLHTDIISWSQLIEQMNDTEIIIKEERLLIPEEIKLQISIPILSVRITAANVCAIGSLKSSYENEKKLDDIEPFYLQKFAGMA